MKKSIFLSVVIFLFSYSLKCQTVDSIKVEQAGDLIKVHYRILNSTDKQTFRVTVTCSLNGGLQSIPKSLSGDFGENVVGGRGEYMVLWDVLKDVDELKSVEFVVKAELTKDYSAIDKSGIKPLSERRLHIYFVGGGPGPKFGGKIGYMGSWGVSAMYLVGKIDDPSDLFGRTEISAFSTSLNLSKRIVNAKSFNLHLQTGFAVARLPMINKDSYTISTEDFSVGFDVGMSCSIKRLAVSIDLNVFPIGQKRGEIEGDTKFIYIGLGYRF